MKFSFLNQKQVPFFDTMFYSIDETENALRQLQGAI